MQAERIHDNDIVRHFKYETSDKVDCIKGEPHVYCYKVINTNVISADDGRRFVLYKALYNNTVFIRLYDEFISEVDHTKYPNIKQKYRFEVIQPETYFTDYICEASYD